jgi:predicted transcriptional regulator of viral defense system
MFQKYQRLRESGLTVFDRRTIATILKLSYASTNPVLHRLVERGILTRLKRDRYVLPETLVTQSRKIANELVKPSCISMWTALSDAGCTTQVPRIIQSVTPLRSQRVEQDGSPTFDYTHLPERLYFGYNIDAKGVFRAPPEKALLDLLYVQQGSLDWESVEVDAFDYSILSEFVFRFPPRVRQALRSSPLYDD